MAKIQILTLIKIPKSILMNLEILKYRNNSIILTIRSKTMNLQINSKITMNKPLNTVVSINPYITLIKIKIIKLKLNKISKTRKTQFNLNIKMIILTIIVSIMNF